MGKAKADDMDDEDMDRVMGKPSAGDMDDEDMPSDEDGDDGGSDVPPEFQSAYDDYEADPSASTMYAMIEACKGGGGGGGLALLLGPKSKKG